VWAKQTIQKFGPITQDASGILEWQAYLMIKALVTQMTLKSFESERKRFHDSRLEIYKQQNVDEYSSLMVQQTKEFNRCQTEVAIGICDLANIKLANFNASSKKYLEDEKLKKIIK
jgi:hypothetical protein